MRVKKMSKELERVKEEIISRLNDNFEDDIYGTSRRILNLKLENINLQIQIEHLMQPAIQKKLLEPMPPMFIKQLPPPTEEEVCEALSTHFENIRYSQLFVSYVGREFEVSYEPFLSQVIAYKKDDGNVSIELELPPKLGKMIFAFYEGIESK